MGVPDDNLQDLERQRLQLEGNVRTLQESLYHWRTWEAEYDALKEEIRSLDENASTQDFLQIGRDFGGSLVNEEEIKVLLGANQGVARSRKQVVDIIVRRIDYVKQNAATMEKRLQTAENQLGALDAIERLPLESGPEYPVTDIMEELDEDGRVISSSVNTPGGHAPELLEVLKKAGIKNIPDVPGQDTGTKATDSQVTEIKDEEDGSETEDNLRQSQTGQEPPTPTPLEARETSQDIPADRVSPPADGLSEDHEEQPVTDVDESPEDASLRREMLQYGLNEVGAVVAELELDDDASDISFDYIDGSYEFDSEEDEDEFGRSTRKVLGEDYHQEMRELEAKLNARGMYNMGKDVNALPDGLRQDLERSQPEPDDKAVSEKKPKKKVAFAQDIDIAPSPQQPPPEKNPAPSRQPDIPPVSDSIVERADRTEKGPTAPEPPKKASRFKSARHTPQANTADVSLSHTNSTPRPPQVRSTRNATASPNPSSTPLFPATPKEPKPFSQPIATGPNPPEDKILADKLVERTVETPAEPPDPGEVDDQLHRKEIATEFYQMRNRMIQRAGGFVNDDEPETAPVETDEPPKRISKFKAARMG